MRRLLSALMTAIFLPYQALALTGSFIEDGKEYGLTDDFYQISQYDQLKDLIPEGCTLLSCDEALSLKDKLTYRVDYFFCDGGVVYGNQVCTVVELGGTKYLKCGDSYQNLQNIRAFVVCPIEGADDTSSESDSYLGFQPDPDAYYCAKDLDGDGAFSQEGEIQECSQTDDNNYLCPIDRVACEATYEKPLCPDGVLNPERDMCQADAQINCPSGYTYDSSLDQCVLVPTCPDGGVLNTVRDRCEKTVINECPAGYTYEPSNGICVKSVNCGEGTFVPERDRCEKAVALSCPTGYTLSGNLCVGSPVCPSGTAYNPTYNKCITSFTPSCPTGYAYNPSTGRCEAQPVCPSGFTYNPATNRCETGASVSYRCSITGKTYSTLTQCQSKCQTAGSCSGNTIYEFCLSIDGPVGYGDPDYWKVIDEEAWNYYREVVCSYFPYLSFCLGATPYCPFSFSFPPNPSSTWKPVWIVANTTEGVFWMMILFARPVSSYTCSLNGQSYSDLTTCQNNCKTSGTCSQVGTCPSGSTLSGGLCIANPTCPNGGTFDGTRDVCWTNYTPSCPAGTTYDSTIRACVANPSCSNGGVFNASADRCEISVITDCGGWSYDSSLRVCYSSPVCENGVYNSNLNECVATVNKDCGTYSYDSANDVCYAPVSCPVGSYSGSIDKCVAEAEHVCPSGTDYSYSWNREVGKCELVPICKEGVYTPSTDGCYVGDFTCPAGDYPCLPIDGKNYCSPHPCQQWASSLEIDDTVEGANDKQPDGQIDENGNCLGTIYIFNGNDYRCRPPGLQTGGSNCCKKTTTWFGLGTCKEREKILAKLRSWGKLDGQCHYVGSYCAVKVLGICLQKKKTYCCFHSVLARIVQEQGRKQLGMGWGEPKSPNCRGFTPDEFQRLDFSKMDFSEWYEDLQNRLDQNLQVFKQDAQQRISNYFNTIQK
jgi:conjugal transfer mating pair stabilization protein TraN